MVSVNMLHDSGSSPIAKVNTGTSLLDRVSYRTLQVMLALVSVFFIFAIFYRVT
jgi:hypothetical protein